MTIAGYVLSGLGALFLLFDAVTKALGLPVVLATMKDLGWAGTLGEGQLLAAILGVCTILYLIPRTSVLGAILLTGYLGGAVATNLRAGTPVFSHVLFGVYLGVVLWGGLYLRDARLRALIPLSD